MRKRFEGLVKNQEQAEAALIFITCVGLGFFLFCAALFSVWVISPRPF